MAKYQGKTVKLNSPSRISKGEPGYGRKKTKVFVKAGNKIKKIMLGDPEMKIKKNQKGRKDSFDARHNCANPGPKTKARYWSCELWK